MAEGTVGELKGMIGIGEKIVVEVADLPDAALDTVRCLPATVSASYRGRELHVSCAQGASHLTEVLEALAGCGVAPVRVYSEPPTLNDVFLEITGSELRDHGADSAPADGR